MHQPCKVILFTILGLILGLLFLLVATCGRSSVQVPQSVPVPPSPTGQAPVPPVVVPPAPSEPPVTAPPKPSDPALRTHRVVCGDTLWDLSGKYLGDPEQWREIWKLNKAKIENPHWIFPGQVFIIPN